MNGKMVIAFVSGALIASGIVYVAVRPVPAPQPSPKSAPQSAANVAVVSPAPAPALAPVVPPAAAVAPVHQKPSPLAPRHRDVVVIARNENPPSSVAETAQPPQAPSVTPPTPEPVPAAPPQPAPQPSTAETTPQPPPAAPPPAPVAVQEQRVPHTVTIAAGTLLPVRIGETVSSARNQPGDSFLATLEQPLVIEGFVIAERGARVEGRVTDADPASRGHSSSRLSVSLVRLATSDGQNIRIRTEPYQKEGAGGGMPDAAKIGAGAAIGAAIGAIAGGGKGAAIGAGVGGVAGAGDVLLTRPKPAEIRVETRLSFRIQDPVTITERLD